MILSRLIEAHDAAFGAVQSALEHRVLPLLARIVFGGVLLWFFWASALTKVVDRQGAEHPVLDYFTVEPAALAQMAPKAFEAAGYNPAELGPEYWLMAYAGTYAEFVLPLLVVIGLFTRLASLGMIGFIAVMTWVDLFRVDQDLAAQAAAYPGLTAQLAAAETAEADAQDDPAADRAAASHAIDRAGAALEAADAALGTAPGPIDVTPATAALRDSAAQIDAARAALRGAERRAKAATNAARKALAQSEARAEAIRRDTIGRLFDRHTNAKIADQRALWVFVLMFLIVRGAGPVSVDGILRLRRESNVTS